MSGESFGDQEAVGGDAQSGVVTEAAPAASFVMIQPEFLFEFLIIPLDAPALIRSADQFIECRGLGQRGEGVLLRFGLMLRPLDEQPLLWPEACASDVAAGMAYADGGEAAGENLIRAFAPLHSPKVLSRQRHRQRLDRQRLTIGRA